MSSKINAIGLFLHWRVQAAGICTCSFLFDKFLNPSREKYQRLTCSITSSNARFSRQGDLATTVGLMLKVSPCSGADRNWGSHNINGNPKNLRAVRVASWAAGIWNTQNNHRMKLWICRPGARRRRNDRHTEMWHKSLTLPAQTQRPPSQNLSVKAT